MTIAITGAGGFLGWHTAVRLRAAHAVETKLLGRPELTDVAQLRGHLAGVETIVHLAGVNRADTGEVVEEANVALAHTLADAIVDNGRPVHVVYGNSIQSVLDNPYGRGKLQAAHVLKEALGRVGGTLADVELPNLFGERGRPYYNSFVATFCHEIAAGRTPNVTEDRNITLLHAQEAADALIDAAAVRVNASARPAGATHRISDVLVMLLDFHAKYAVGQIPALRSQFAVDLFNTYRSYLFPDHYPFYVVVTSDTRGNLFETVRSHGGTGQTFVSTTLPGVTRGEHYHLRKIERFMVVRGSAEIALRRVCDHEIVRFHVGGDRPCFVDMPTMWVHKITNTGEEDLITLFWTDQLHDPAAPDTYWEPVELNEGAYRR